MTVEPAVKLLKTALKVEADFVVVAPELTSVTTYEVIALPPSETGAPHRTVTVKFSFVCAGLGGADGEVIGVAFTTVDQLLTAPKDTALTLKLYSVPPCNPLMVISFDDSPNTEDKSPI